MSNTRWRTRNHYTKKVEARERRRDELFKRITRSSFPITPILSAKHLLSEEDLAKWGIREDGLVITPNHPYHQPEEAMTDEHTSNLTIDFICNRSKIPGVDSMADYLTKQLGLGGDCNAK